MILRPCRCGKLPAITQRMLIMMHVVQVKCPCGQHGVAASYIKPADEARTVQAAVDGWNLAG
jgi:hypothetical protein